MKKQTRTQIIYGKSATLTATGALIKAVCNNEEDTFPTFEEAARWAKARGCEEIDGDFTAKFAAGESRMKRPVWHYLISKSDKGWNWIPWKELGEVGDDRWMMWKQRTSSLADATSAALKFDHVRPHEQHTPGPWVLAGHGWPLTISTEDGQIEGQIVAQVPEPTWDKESGQYDVTRQDAGADASLIASAPQLLHALKDLLLRVEGKFKCECHKPQSVGYKCEICEAWAAVDQAEGHYTDFDVGAGQHLPL